MEYVINVDSNIIFVVCVELFCWINLFFIYVILMFYIYVFLVVKEEMMFIVFVVYLIRKKM